MVVIITVPSFVAVLDNTHTCLSTTTLDNFNIASMTSMTLYSAF